MALKSFHRIIPSAIIIDESGHVAKVIDIIQQCSSAALLEFLFFVR
jgi:hypothetical protein